MPHFNFYVCRFIRQHRRLLGDADPVINGRRRRLSECNRWDRFIRIAPVILDEFLDLACVVSFHVSRAGAVFFTELDRGTTHFIRAFAGFVICHRYLGEVPIEPLYFVPRDYVEIPHHFLDVNVQP
ncbi:hypothetical protein WL99_22355 [Burkholderia cepacia]|nr:hypothetical protein WL99_22355 [Burkholderia cepacia]